jgi:hypothetical protein
MTAELAAGLAVLIAITGVLFALIALAVAMAHFLDRH